MNDHRDPIWLLGAGGHARVLIDAIRAEGRYVLVGALDDDTSRHDDHIDGVPIRDAISAAALRRQRVERAIIAIGNNEVRAAIARRLDGLVEWGHVVHPQAHVAAKVIFHEGTVILAGAVVQTGTRVGRHVIINTSASVDHDNSVDDFAHVAPGAHLGGHVCIGEGSLVGIGSTVVNGRSVGRWCTLGAGAVAVADIPDEVIAVGVPARWAVALIS